MAFHDARSKEVTRALSREAKPRLKWTQELHQKFAKAVDQLGGPAKATPKSLIRVMGINGLTLYHIKSHLQKYRMGKSQQMQTNHKIKEKENGNEQRRHLSSKSSDRSNESSQITRALQIQMEVQRKLHEQIEVQKHLQLRIEAQGKYLQSVLQTAQETLAQYSSCSIEAKQAKARLSRLMSMVDSECTNSSFSGLTQSTQGLSMSKCDKEKNDVSEKNRSSPESSLGNSKEGNRGSNNVEKMKLLENLDLKL